MSCLSHQTSPSAQAIAWLQELLRTRIHPALCLNLSRTSDSWYLSCLGVDYVLSMPLFPQLYQLGTNTGLPCCRIFVEHECLKAIASDLIAPGCSISPQPLVHFAESGLQLQFDVPGLVYWMQARCEEINPPVGLLDNHSRFPATSSHAFMHGYLERPVVDEWIIILRQLVLHLWPRLPLHQFQFSVVLSHDVDQPSRFSFCSRWQLVKRIGGSAFRYRDWQSALNAPLIRLSSRQKLHPRDPCNTFEWLMDQSEALGIRSAFYFLCGRTDPSRDADYEPDHPAIRSLMRRIHERGHEIGLHPSYNSGLNINSIALEAARLKRIALEEGIHQAEWGGRMHYLRWHSPATANGLAQAGLHYDSTLTYADRPGFRCGTCHAYPMFDPIVQRQLELVQRPLIVMERSVISMQYLGHGYSPIAMDLIQQLKQRCSSVGGQFTLLWHNSTLATPADRKFYQDVLFTSAAK